MLTFICHIMLRRYCKHKQTIFYCLWYDVALTRINFYNINITKGCYSRSPYQDVDPHIRIRIKIKQVE